VVSMTASTRSSKEIMTMLCTIAIFMIHQVGNSSRENTSGIVIGACNSMHDNHQIFLQQINKNNSTEKNHCIVMKSESPIKMIEGRVIVSSMSKFPHLSSWQKAFGWYIIPSSCTYLPLSCLLPLAWGRRVRDHCPRTSHLTKCWNGMD